MSGGVKMNVLVTGFGPFGQHRINASGVAVKELSTLNLEGICLTTDELPVQYHKVRDIVPTLWEQHQPDLCIHVGVSKHAEGLRLEKVAHNLGYNRFDVTCQVPKNQCCIEGEEDCKETDLDLDEVKDFLSRNNAPCTVEISHEAGRFLCGYVYYLSLHQRKGTVLFVHVPHLDKPYSSTDLALGLKLIIQAAVNQIKQVKNQEIKTWMLQDITI